MIGRRSKPSQQPEDLTQTPRGFDDYEMKLGDMMRGERATMGKSLLDVQRELRIKATYIAAIENCDPDVFETQGFVAGYVRSYARYLNLDPDATFAQFCAESGFQTAHGMDSAAVGPRKETVSAAPSETARDPFREPSLPFAPADDGFFSRLEPGAIGSVTVLIALIAALGYGGWSVLQEVQRVQIAPVDQTPLVITELDPLQGAGVAAARQDTDDAPAQGVISAETPRIGPGSETASSARPGSGVFTPPTNEGVDRLYRPRALDVPVLTARDGPISTLDSNEFGSFAERVPDVPSDHAAAQEAIAALRPGFPASDPLAISGFGPNGFDSGTWQPGSVGVPRGPALPDLLASDQLHVVAARPSWVRVSDAAGGVLYTGILSAGETWTLPRAAVDPIIEVGESSAIYYIAGGRTFGPTGPRGVVTEDFALEPMVLAAILPEADLRADTDLAQVLANLGKPVEQVTPQPQVVETIADRITVVATREAWVRVRAASGSVLYEAVMQPGDFYTVPVTEEAPTIRTGDAGAIYFAAAGQTYGPYGGNGAVADNLALSVDTITTTMAAADIQSNAPLARAVAELNASNRVPAGAVSE